MVWASAGALFGFALGGWQWALIGAAIGYALIAVPRLARSLGPTDANTFVGPVLPQ